MYEIYGTYKLILPFTVDISIRCSNCGWLFSIKKRAQELSFFTVDCHQASISPTFVKRYENTNLTMIIATIIPNVSPIVSASQSKRSKLRPTLD